MNSQFNRAEVLVSRFPTTSTLRFAYGRYEQSPFAYQVLKTSGNRDLKSGIAEHYVIELEHELSPQTELKAALYYKDLKNLVTRSVNTNALFDDSGTPLTTPYRNQGIGFVNGAELFLRHRVSEKFFGWLSYAYTHAERQETPNARLQNRFSLTIHTLSASLQTTVQHLKTISA